MREFFKRSVLRYLRFLAKHRIARCKPIIIGVTGSVGKTSTKDAIFHILRNRFDTVRNEKSYNTEFGLPLAILEQTSGFSSALSWLWILGKSTFVGFFDRRKVEIFVLEMGVEKVGDMDELLEIVHPKIAVMTAIKPVHMAEGQFKSLEEIFQEKKKILKFIESEGKAIFNGDDEYLARLKKELGREKFSFGSSDDNQLIAKNIETNKHGLSFEISLKNLVGDIREHIQNAKNKGNENAVVHLNLLGRHQVYVALAALSVAIQLGFTLQEGCEALKDFVLPPGRMNHIEGKKGSIIIDSSYNASPETVKSALDILAEFKDGRKIAVLGNMNELGSYSVQAHEEVGKYVAGKADMLLTVGEMAKGIAEAARSSGFKGEIYEFSDALRAAEFFQDKIQNSDIILVKGSQNKVRLERFVKTIMEEPKEADKLLARQGLEWEKIG